MATATLGEALTAHPAPPPSRARLFVERLGRHTRVSVETVGRTGRFAAQTVRSFREVSTWRPNVILQARRLGVDSLPIGLSIDSLLMYSASVVAKMDQGQGSVGRMLNDESLYTGADSLVSEMRALVTDVRARPKRYINLRLF